MRTILAPIDFSDASINALSFAAELSRRAQALLIAVNVLNTGEDEDESVNKLKTVEADLRQTFGNNLKFETRVLHGSLVDVLQDLIENLKPGLLVMGTKGASGLKRILIGSNTVKVLSKTTLPVLVIPEVARFESFLKKGKNRIVLATDLDSLDDEEILDALKKIAMMIVAPGISVLSVRPKNTMLPDYQRLERDFLLSFFKPEIETERITVFSSNVISGINLYLDKKSEDTGLIAMIARDSGELVQKHYTREMASHTHLPLLVMHDVKS
jgi:nucleotide-binding universal stress UspA family protein